MPQADLVRELASLGAQEKSATAALLSAMVLMTMRGSAEPARAQTQLDLVLNDEEPEAQLLKPLARLLSGHLAETRRQDETADKLGQQVKDGQRRIEQLNAMLEGLKAIERTLPAPSRASPAAAPAPAKW